MTSSGSPAAPAAFDRAAYLARIGYDGPLAPTLTTLRALHRAHLLAVPFENLDIHLGRPIVLDVDALYRKIVVDRRGGFCYELNGLFAALLRDLGFAVTLLSAGVARAGGGFGPEFDHLALRIDLDEPWLADVGFGALFVEPLRLDERGEQPDGESVFRLAADGDRLILRRRDRDPAAPWADEYRFTLRPRALADYAAMCRHHQTSPDTTFTHKRTCSRLTPTGRVTLSEHRLIVAEDGRRDEYPVAGDDHFRALLREHFGVVLPGLPWRDPLAGN